MDNILDHPMYFFLCRLLLCFRNAYNRSHFTLIFRLHYLLVLQTSVADVDALLYGRHDVSDSGTHHLLVLQTSVAGVEALLYGRHDVSDSGTHHLLVLQTSVAGVDAVLFGRHDVSDSGTYHLLRQYAGDRGRENQLQHFPTLSVHHHL